MLRDYSPASWQKTARYRRVLLLFLLISSTTVATGFMADALPLKGGSVLEFSIVVLFGALFAWISIGFWTALVGFFILLRRYDRYTISRTLHEERTDIGPDTRTAILLPIANEEVDRVFAGLAATYLSLKETGQLDHFDFYVLSDSGDPDKWVEEEEAWHRTCLTLDGFNRIFYRHRKANVRRKSGNVADFCRRWGTSYEYMIVFDADSVMAGDTMVRMVRIMELHSDVGILQTLPLAVNKDSLIARVQQFVNHMYGPMFSAGLHFWQLGDAQYWGHNAVIRVKPFMDHCGLPTLPGRPPLGGEILSHDFVESALMRRAGYGVWLAYDLGGSYEEIPPTLLDELKRDRRWCQGNMQHLRLLFTRGLFPAHRALFVNGAMSYISGLLWFIFLCLSTVTAIYEAIVEPNYFPAERNLFPDWPIWNPGWAVTLLVSTVIILFLPKVLGLLLVMFRDKEADSFGGKLPLLGSFFGEILFSTLLAPIRMIFHSRFVFKTLLGQQTHWTSQERGERGTTWIEALRFHWTSVALAFFWGAIVYLINRSFFWWLTPIIVSLLFSIPFSVWSSRSSVGRGFRSLRLFMTPEEIEAPPELKTMKLLLESPATVKGEPIAGRSRGFVRAVVDPSVNALHLSFLRSVRKVSPAIAARRRQLCAEVLLAGPDSLSPRKKKELLSDPLCMHLLHEKVWELPPGEATNSWGLT